MTTATLAGDRFDMGRVVSRTFGIVGRNFVNFYVMALVLYGAPQFVLQLIGASAGWRGGATARFDLSAALVTVVVGFLGAFLNLLMQGALTWGAIADLNGRRATVGELLRVGLRSWLPLLGILVCFSLAAGVGFVLLIVPGLILVTMWIVVVPVQVAERTGVFGSFTRSAQLTKGHRWAVFGLLVVFYIAAGAFGLAINSTVGMIFFGSANPMAIATATESGSPMVYVGEAVILLINLVFVVVVAAGIASLYYELRTGREGIGPEALAYVFS